MLLMRPVREVQSSHIHARREEMLQHLLIEARWPKCADDFRASHRLWRLPQCIQSRSLIPLLATAKVPSVSAPVAITGANGFLGRHLVRVAGLQGVPTRPLVRRA